MCGKNFIFWCCVLLFLIAFSSKSQQSFASNKKECDNLTVRYELDADSTTNYGHEMKTLRYNLYKKSTNNTQNDKYYTNSSNSYEGNSSIQYEFGTYSIKNHENDHMLVELTNSTKINSKKNSTSHEIYRELMRMKSNNDSISYEFYETFNGKDKKYNIVPYEMCNNITCIPLCCPLGDRLIDDKCILRKNKIRTSFFPNVYEDLNDSLQNENRKRVNELFHLAVYDPCQKKHHLRLKYKYIFFTNGSLYLPSNYIFIEPTSYCLATMQNKFDVIICSKTMKKIIYEDSEQRRRRTRRQINPLPLLPSPLLLRLLRIVSVLLLMGIFLVYSILPELRNTHSFLLRIYIGWTIAGHIIKFVMNLITLKTFICVTIGFIRYYCYVSSYFWLSVMSFDMWRAFKKLHSLQRNKEQREKKKLIMYSIYACGCPLILAILCGSMNFIPDIPKKLQPKFHNKCWFVHDTAALLYFYVPQSICIISSIYLSISTALKIYRYEKDTTHHLKNSESRCFNEDKKWFNLYLKLFIMVFIIMGIKWCITVLYNSYKLIVEYRKYNNIYKYYANSRMYVFFIYLADVLLSLSIFITFVCKKTIKQLLLKRFGWKQKCDLLPETRYEANATFSKTCTTIPENIPMEKLSSSGEETNVNEIHSTELTVTKLYCCKKKFYRRSEIGC